MPYLEDALCYPGSSTNFVQCSECGCSMLYAHVHITAKNEYPHDPSYYCKRCANEKFLKNNP